jgi:hypothetical protein
VSLLVEMLVASPSSSTSLRCRRDRRPPVSSVEITSSAESSSLANGAVAHAMHRRLPWSSHVIARRCSPAARASWGGSSRLAPVDAARDRAEVLRARRERPRRLDVAADHERRVAGW